MTDHDLLLWTSKIFYGQYLRDHFDGKGKLQTDNETKIYTGFRSIFLFLQSVRYYFRLTGNFFFDVFSEG